MKLSCENIKKTYIIKNSIIIEVIKGVSLSLADNDYYAIRGASGAGKSTLLHILATLDLPDIGEMKFADDEGNILDLRKLNDVQLSKFRNRHIGFVFQFHHLLPEFTALENVMMPSLIAGNTHSTSKRNALELMDFTGMLYRKDHKPAELSGGEQQRIAIARALINKPTFLFADEPTGNLDEENSNIVLDLIDSIRENYNIICLIATHSKSVAERANKIITIKDGLIQL